MLDVIIKESETITSPTTGHRRMQPRRKREMNQAQTCSTVPENVDNIINTVTGETPKKTKKAIGSGDAPTPIRLRWKYCTGKPYLVEAFCSDKDGNRTSRTPYLLCM